ncbi:phage holin family protein [Celeribacter sp.]|uniref:phage holin family protein n=1 Tax=Celeribacter sp. TaxID=1890673 RepID=UPI003A90B3ED
MFDHLKYAAKDTARRAAIGALGSVLVAVGVVMLTVSAWFALLLVTTPAIAALILGGGYTGVGLVILGLSGSRSQRRPHAAQTAASAPPADPMDRLTSAFLQGMETGAQMGARKH